MRLTSGERNDGGRARGGWREEEKEEGGREGGGATAAYQWVPFKFPGIIGGKKEGGREGERKMMHASSDR